MKNRKYGSITIVLGLFVSVMIAISRDTTVVKAVASFLSTVAHDTTLTGDGTTTAPLGVANNGVGTAQLSNGAVTAPKIATGQVIRSLSGLTDDVILGAGSNISITQNGNTLTIASTLGLTSVSHDSTLQGNGTGGSPLGIANLGVGTNQLANSAITAQKIAPGQVVTSLNGLKDNLILGAGSNISIDQSGNTLTISSLLGLTSVAHDTTLTGDGTTVSPLGVAPGQTVRSINNLADNVTLAAGSNISITPSGNTLTIASNQPPEPFVNPLRVATLQWYERNRTGAGVSFGQEVFGLVFDGSNMWATTVGSSLIKFRPSDGAILGTFSTGAGDSGGAMTYDGANIWVGTNVNRLLLKFRASDGALMGTFSYFTVTSQPLAFDGEHIWVGDGFKLFKLRPSDGAIVDQVALPNPSQALAVDNQGWMWAALLNDTVIRVHVVDSEIIGPYPVGSQPMSMAFDGANMWVANFQSKSVTKLRGSDGAVLNTFNLNQNNPRNIAFDGANMWVANFASNSVTRIRVSDGSMLTFSVGTHPRRVAFDGANMWASHTSGVTKL